MNGSSFRFRPRSLVALLAATLAMAVALARHDAFSEALAQAPPAGQAGDKQPAYPPLPNDHRLLALHREFVNKAITLAAEYERNKQIEKAAAVYGEILKLVPAHPKARQMLEKIQQREAGANRTVFTVWANKAWQDTGIRLVSGKPVRLTATGTWTFKMSHELGPEGMEIPEVLREFKLGSLIGVVGGGDPKKTKPFYIGPHAEFVAAQSGPLLVRMHDSDASDNQGKVVLEMTGQFDRP